MTDLIQRLIRWPLWSWRNFTVTVVLALVSLGALGRVGAALTLDAGPPAPGPSAAASVIATPTSSSSTATAPPTSATEIVAESAAAAPGEPVSDCAQAAELFIHAWARPSLTSTAWLAGLKPYAAHPLLERLATTDPARVPATRILTDPQPVEDPGDGEAFRIVTDAGPVIVRAVKAERVCVIHDVHPDNDVHGAPTPRLGPAETGAPDASSDRVERN
ncbi:MAG: hypothetical protein L0H79_08990 [Intrasporangium sp.]|uniref:hypothetical protein n=1 Tax=Intrasporangium sp. TaxID=1925024 RepID=UPI002648491B|nr:hypothetical protein [Intrasporangium sp.]MDN5795871.1 hypothetical protein [Intrasporangium sp.]